MRVLSEEEASDLVRAAQGTRDEALIVLALRTGMSQGKLAALRWEDLDGTRPVVKVRRAADTRTKTGEGRMVGMRVSEVEVMPYRGGPEAFLDDPGRLGGDPLRTHATRHGTCCGVCSMAA